MPAPEYVLRSYAGAAVPGQLTQELGATDLQFTISPTTGWVEDDGNPLGTSGPFTVAVDLYTPSVEKILCSAVNLVTGLVTVYVDGDGWNGRGYDGTTAIAHVPGSTAGVQPCWSAAEAKEANQAVYDVLGGGSESLIGVPIGTSIDFRGSAQTLPTNFMVEDGTALARSSYSALFTAITVAGTGNTTLAGTTITNVDPAVTALIVAGYHLTGLNIGSPGTIVTVTAVTSTTLTISSGVGVIAGTAGAFIVYPYGAGDGSTTFTLPDARGRTTMGAGLVGSSTQPTLYVGQTGGLSTNTIANANLPNHGHLLYVDPGSGGGTSYQMLYTIPGSGSQLVEQTPGTSPVDPNQFILNFSLNATAQIKETSNANTALENKSPFSTATKIIRVQ